MRKIILYIVIFFGITSFRTVGSSTAYLKCKSESGRTIFNAEIQDIDGGLEKAELIVDGVKLNFDNDDDAKVILDSKNGIYTIFIESKSKSKFLKFWAIPKTFKTVIENSSESKYDFKAKIYSTEPRKGKDLQTPEIELNCSLNYKI